MDSQLVSSFPVDLQDEILLIHLT